MLGIYVVCLMAGFTAALSGSLDAAWMCGTQAVLSGFWFRSLYRQDHGMDTTLGWWRWQMLLTMLVASALGGAWLLGADQTAAVKATGTIMGAVVASQMLWDLLTPALLRARLRRDVLPNDARLRWSALVLGALPATPVVLPRLVRAMTEVGVGGPVRPRLVGGSSRDPDPVRVALLGWITTESRRRRGWQAPAPMLGHTLGVASPIWLANASDLTEAERARLPRLLQAAAELDRLCEAVCVLDGAVIVLPAGAPAVPTPEPAPPSGLWRRSRRAPWRDALAWLDEPRAMLVLALDLAPTDAMADRLLARRLVRLPEAHRRTPAMQALGLARAATALHLRPVQEDAAGHLYQLGRHEDPSLFVAVHDRVLGTDGASVEHWISVPPYVATAWEAVAWSFGLSEAEYRPSRET